MRQTSYALWSGVSALEDPSSDTPSPVHVLDTVTLRCLHITDLRVHAPPVCVCFDITLKGTSYRAGSTPVPDHGYWRVPKPTWSSLVGWWTEVSPYVRGRVRLSVPSRC